MSRGEKTMQGIEGDKKRKKRKRKWLRIALPAAAVLIVILFMINSARGAGDAVPVYTQTVAEGDIDTELSVSGKVTAEETAAFFAPADVRIEEIEVSKGDVVRAGDVLICFDKEAAAYAKQQSELEGKISSADYNSNLKYNNEQKEKLAQAVAEIAECEAAIDNYETYIEDLTNGITDLTALKKADLYARIYSVEKEMNGYELAMQTPDEDTDVEALLRKKTEKQNELNKLNNELNLLSDYKTDYGWEDLLTQAKKDLADYETRLSEAKSVKSGAESAIVNSDKLAGYELNKEKSELTSADAEKKYEAALNGITAGFNGVVSEMGVSEGASVQEGTQLMLLESIDDVCVEFQASKYMLETLAIGQQAEITISGKTYTGSVSKINHIAEENSSGTPMVAARVHIDNPDENIFLGIEAKLKILTASEKGVLQVPVEAVNVDSQGEFCYVIENDILAKRYVETGISSEIYIQITGGLSENEEIVTSSVYGTTLEEGMPVSGMSMPGMEDVDMEASAEEETAVSQEYTEAETDNG